MSCECSAPLTGGSHASWCPGAPRPGIPAALRHEQTRWADMVIRVLSFHHFSRSITVSFSTDGQCFLYVAGAECIGDGRTLGQALEAALRKINDDDLVKAWKAVEAESRGEPI